MVCNGFAGIAWHGVNVLVELLQWKTAQKLRKIAEERKLLRLNSGKDYDMENAASELLYDDTVKCIVCSYLEEISELGCNC